MTGIDPCQNDGALGVLPCAVFVPVPMTSLVERDFVYHERLSIFPPHHEPLTARVFFYL